MKEIIERTNLRIITSDATILQTAIEGNEKLGTLFGVYVPDNWTEFWEVALQYSLDKFSQGEEESGWSTHLPIHKTDNKLIGSYKRKPTEDGIVEIGYEITENNRGKLLQGPFVRCILFQI